MQLRTALAEYETFYERKVAEVEALIVEKPPDAENRLADIRNAVDNETANPDGRLHSMNYDLMHSNRRKNNK